MVINRMCKESIHASMNAHVKLGASVAFLILRITDVKLNKDEQLAAKDEQIKLIQAQLSAKDEQITQLTAALQQQTSAIAKPILTIDIL